MRVAAFIAGGHGFRALLWPWPLWKVLFPGMAMTLNEVTEAMIRHVVDAAPKRVLEVADVQQLARV
ncbi:MAG: hypothetical protein ACKVPX_17560 [Myxococcaceae bacterium]